MSLSTHSKPYSKQWQIQNFVTTYFIRMYETNTFYVTIRNSGTLNRTLLTPDMPKIIHSFTWEQFLTWLYYLLLKDRTTANNIS